MRAVLLLLVALPAFAFDDDSFWLDREHQQYRFDCDMDSRCRAEQVRDRLRELPKRKRRRRAAK